MKLRITAFMLLALASASFANEGLNAFNRKDYNEAYRILSQDPQKPESMYGIGRIVLEGLGAASRNVEKGLGLITRSSEAGYRPATVFLAEYYERNGNLIGNGTELSSSDIVII